MQTVVKNEYFVNKIEKSYFILVKIKDWPLLVSLIQLFLVKVTTMDISNVSKTKMMCWSRKSQSFIRDIVRLEDIWKTGIPVIVYLFSNLRTIYICLMLINDI